MEHAAVREGGMARWVEKNGRAALEQGEAKVVALRQAALGEARRSDGPKRTSSGGCGNA
jgi:hypothetical protein